LRILELFKVEFLSQHSLCLPKNSSDYIWFFNQSIAFKLQPYKIFETHNNINLKK